LIFVGFIGRSRKSPRLPVKKEIVSHFRVGDRAEALATRHQSDSPCRRGVDFRCGSRKKRLQVTSQLFADVHAHKGLPHLKDDFAKISDCHDRGTHHGTCPRPTGTESRSTWHQRRPYPARLRIGDDFRPRCSRYTSVVGHATSRETISRDAATCFPLPAFEESVDNPDALNTRAAGVRCGRPNHDRVVRCWKWSKKIRVALICARTDPYVGSCNTMNGNQAGRSRECADRFVGKGGDSIGKRVLFALYGLM